MKLEDFNIDFIKFNNEEHRFSYNLDSTFFSLKENSLYHECAVQVDLLAVKSDSTITLEFDITGTVSTECERCLKSIALPTSSHYVEVWKLTGSKEMLENENYVSYNDQVINIYDSLYEQICINLPNRKICANAQPEDSCSIDYDSPTIETIDPRWDKLKKLIDK